ncbi:ubiquinone anaerobic biosynthesis protein UbiV [Brevundimonas vancanneytii]|uniref:Ubiquinone biosynthesis protein UbiV n=1 Tax=Brevundimonas vancanneytii TaxID=1325724 RepID=A0A4P1K419_9CAUL|nr:U32 family peptidase [Brevundimonas vancanneytii]VTO14363.1 putative protease [Brevundimonas vancanneytii]
MEIALGPVFYHWSSERLAAFYETIAAEPTIDRVYLGEVVCGKRSPLTEHALAAAAERLIEAGKTVVWSGLALPATVRDRKAIAALSQVPDLIEVNDVSALLVREGPFVAGPLLNAYNEGAVEELARLGCVRLCPNVELSLEAIGEIAARRPGMEIELFAFGRLPLALSGRCYHARSHGLHKDACQFVCDQDPDGMTLRTLEGEPFLAVNGVQTQSYGIQMPDFSVAEMRTAGVSALRLSPHTGDMAAVARAFRAYADNSLTARELAENVRAVVSSTPFVGGYLHGQAGVAPARFA